MTEMDPNMSIYVSVTFIYNLHTPREMRWQKEYPARHLSGRKILVSKHQKQNRIVRQTQTMGTNPMCN